jgi:ABC-type phosphate transport system ATPase subunit
MLISFVNEKNADILQTKDTEVPRMPDWVNNCDQNQPYGLSGGQNITLIQAHWLCLAPDVRLGCTLLFLR